MDILPPGQQQRLLLKNNPHSAADFSAGHAFSPDQFRCVVSAVQIDLGMAITENVDMGWQVIVYEDDHAQAVGAKYSDHSH
jgi:hypothetical protein